MIEVIDLCKTFHDKKRGEIRAVDRVSFQCRPGEIFGLLGPNGAGKTTTLRMLATILQPSSGSARIQGYDIARQGEEVRRNIGFPVRLDRALRTDDGAGNGNVFRRTVRPFRARKLLRASKRFSRNWTLSRLPIPAATNFPPGRSSAFPLREPFCTARPVLFFDEPTNGLDILSARTITRFIRRCRDDGQTVVFSTHIMSEVEALCDRIAIVYAGKIAAIGTLAELRATDRQAGVRTRFPEPYRRRRIDAAGAEKRCRASDSSCRLTEKNNIEGNNYETRLF